MQNADSSRSEFNSPAPNASNFAPFSITPSAKGPLRQIMFEMLLAPVEKIFHLRTLNNMYRSVSPIPDDARFTDLALQLLNVDYAVSDTDRARIPAKGPVVVVANHPFGAIEGIMLTSLLTSLRPDVKFLANYLLGRIPEMRRHLIEVDPFGSSRSTARNIRPLKRALQWLEDGGMLVVFPAGEVAHIRWTKPVVTDPPWNTTVARLVRRTKAPVLPVHFDGRNSNLFQLLGLINGRLRTVMLPHELLNKSNQRIPVRIGNPVEYSRLERFDNDTDLTGYLRFRTYLLAGRGQNTDGESPSPKHNNAHRAHSVPVIEATDGRILESEIGRLPTEARLVEGGEYQAFYARSAAIPKVLQEIGRLREITFRQVGEGTGRRTDIDRFDDYYIHLFVWNKERRELVGGYRLGLTDEIVAQYGIKGLYTRTLFKFKKQLIDEVNPALELGRSFIRPEYQREYAPLHLLWRGIGHYVIRYPQYKMLFGPVSITNRYHTISRQLLVDFLKNNRFASRLAAKIKPTNPLKERRYAHIDDKAHSRLVGSLEEVDTLIGEIETEQRGIPILLKHYLRLNGRLLGFNIDPDFSDVLDGLILVDLRQTDPRILQRYMGKSGAAEFLRFHRCGAE